MSSGNRRGAAIQCAGGTAGFAGYEYQIEATVWLALELMLARSVTEKVVIEPPSQEDVEAAIQDPTKRALAVASVGGPRKFAFQIKRRSSAPWSASHFAAIITRGRSGDEATKLERKSPVEMLGTDKSMRFVMITNETTSARLRQFEVEDVLDDSEAITLPARVGKGMSDSAQAALALRISVHGGVTEEVLVSRIGRLLSSHGHVAAVDHEDCVAELREAVRRRMRGSEPGHWKRAELVEEIVRHNGSVAPRRAMDRYVRPRCFEQIEEKLDTLNAVVIAGSSGTGKTLTAEVLEDRFGRGDPPFDVVSEEKGPSHIARQLMREDPVLFHLRDPWGGNRLVPGADAWSGELPKLMAGARPGKKFLVTSRSDVMHSAGLSVVRELGAYTVEIELEDYGHDRLREIYDGIASDLTGSAWAVARDCRETVLNSLSRPYEIDRFLVALSRGSGRPVAELVAESQIDAISSVIAKQLAPSGREGAASAAILWALLSARGAVARSVIVRLQREIRSIDGNVRPNVEGILDFLVAGRNVRQETTMVSFHHPRVEEGLRLVFNGYQGEAEHALSLAVTGLVDMDRRDEDWGVETATGVLRAVGNLKDMEMVIDVDPAAKEADKRLSREAPGGSRQRIRVRTRDAGFGAFRIVGVHTEPFGTDVGCRRAWAQRIDDHGQLARAIVDRDREGRDCRTRADTPTGWSFRSGGVA